MFRCLWETSIVILEAIIDSGELDKEALGWDVYGLASGHMSDIKCEKHRKLVAALKYRLRAALLALPSLERRARNEYEILEPLRVGGLAKARIELHKCTVLLLERFRQEERHRIRWRHTVAVVDTWLRMLGYASVAKQTAGDKKCATTFPFPTVDSLSDATDTCAQS